MRTVAAGYMTTENSAKFKGEPTPSDLLTYKSVGANEESGFTHNKNREPVTFHADYAHKADAPGKNRKPVTFHADYARKADAPGRDVF